MGRKQKEDTIITTRMLRSLYKEISEHVKQDGRYNSAADFIRDACREKLVELKNKK